MRRRWRTRRTHALSRRAILQMTYANTKRWTARRGLANTARRILGLFEAQGPRAASPKYLGDGPKSLNLPRRHWKLRRSQGLHARKDCNWRSAFLELIIQSRSTSNGAILGPLLLTKTYLPNSWPRSRPPSKRLSKSRSEFADASTRGLACIRRRRAHNVWKNEGEQIVRSPGPRVSGHPTI